MSSWLIGIDEAGLAPNLGPLVITATLWSLPDQVEPDALWNLFSSVLSRKPRKAENLLHVADSKQVHQPHKGIRPLEIGVQCALRIAGITPLNLRALWKDLDSKSERDYLVEPWNTEDELSLPCDLVPADLEPFIERWKNREGETGVRLCKIVSEVVSTARYNCLIDQHQNKSLVLSTLVFSLLRTIWDPRSDDRFLIVGDKHGGRNRYTELLQQITEDETIQTLDESNQISIYRVRNSELRFQVGGEEHLPVAVASMVSKYVREVSLIAFNRFWQHRIPGLLPTKGYPVDAARFRREVDPTREELGITDRLFWRCR